MSQQQSASLLWINKDASNVHSKKHVAEVNAHVQRSGTKKKPLRQHSAGVRRASSSARRLSRIESLAQSPTFDANQSGTESDAYATDRDLSPDPNDLPLDLIANALADSTLSTSRKSHNPLVFSCYLEQGIAEGTDVVTDAGADDHDQDSPVPNFQLVEITNQFGLAPTAGLDASNLLPGLLTDLSQYDKMLVHTHLTHMPQMYYGLSTSAAYCPVRTSSVVNMLRSQVGFIWVLVSLEMFIETVRKSNTRQAAILRRKSYAYKLMSQSLVDQSNSEETQLLIGPTSAAIAEMFCGDPDKALTHLNGIDAFIAARGGVDYVKKLDLTTSMPVFAISAYRVLLHDGLSTAEAFQQARSSFVATMRSLLSWNKKFADALACDPSDAQRTPDEGFDGGFDLAEGPEALREAREKAFVKNELVRKFIAAEYNYLRPGERIDHFVVLYNLNRAIAEHGVNFQQAAHFIDRFVDDVESGGSTKDVESSIKISGVCRLLTNRQAHMYTDQPSAGLACAWSALDALEIMKLLSPDSQKSIRQTLHALLIGDRTRIVTEEELLQMELALVTEWQSRHVLSSPSSG